MSIRNILLERILSAIESGAAGGPFLKTTDPIAQGVASNVAFPSGISVGGLDLFIASNQYLIESTQDWIDNTVLVSPTERLLLNNATYEINGVVSRDFELQTDGFNTIKGDNPNIDVDVYSGTGTAWNDVGAGSGLTIIRCSSRGVAGNGSTFISQSNAAFILSIDTGFIEYDNMGSSDAIINLHDKVSFGSLNIPVLSGLVINAINTPTISFSNAAMILTDLAQVTAIDLTPATSVSSITIDMAFRGGSFAGSIGIKGAIDSGNLLSTARGLISNSNFRTLDIPLSGITIDDLKWTLRDNQGVRNTLPDSQSTCMNRITSTVIPSVNVPIEIGGGSVSGSTLDDWTNISSSQFTVDIETGRTTYIGLDPIRVPVNYACTLNPDQGANKQLLIYIGLGLFGEAFPTARQESRTAINIDSNDPQPIGTFTQITFNNGDYISPMIAVSLGETIVDVLATNNKVRVN